MAVLEVRQGSSPVILGFPHTGTDVPASIRERLNDNGRILADTDWHIHDLYQGLLPDATAVRATFHRYVIDANRDPAGVSLYPGQNTTGLVPETDFDGLPIWKEGKGPTEADIAERLRDFHAPYHAALAAEIARVKAIHGVAVLYDCHSIRSHIPFLFEGRLPDFNIGTDMGKTCATEIERAAAEIAAGADGYSHILNGRFKGGWTTVTMAARTGRARDPDGTGAIDASGDGAPPFALDRAKADRLRRPLKAILERIETVAKELKRTGSEA